MSYAKRVDVNHQEIVRNLRAVPGVYVQDVSSELPDEPPLQPSLFGGAA